MADYNKTDEEKVEDLKKWWGENGTSVIAGITIAIVGLFGWQYWQSYQIDQAESASSLLNQFKQSSDPSKILSELKADYSGTPYASLAAFSVAKTAAEKGKNSQAITHLNWLIQHSSDENFKDIARIRLVRIYIAAKKLSEADTILQHEFPVAYLSLIDELKGDLYLAKNNTKKARESYDRAILSAAGASIEYLKMKRADLGKES